MTTTIWSWGLFVGDKHLATLPNRERAEWYAARIGLPCEVREVATTVERSDTQTTRQEAGRE